LSNIASFIAHLKACANRPLIKKTNALKFAVKEKLRCKAFCAAKTLAISIIF
jgi:hypothetical protein